MAEKKERIEHVKGQPPKKEEKAKSNEVVDDSKIATKPLKLTPELIKRDGRKTDTVEVNIRDGTARVVEESEAPKLTHEILAEKGKPLQTGKCFFDGAVVEADAWHGVPLALELEREALLDAYKGRDLKDVAVFTERDRKVKELIVSGMIPDFFSYKGVPDGLPPIEDCSDILLNALWNAYLDVNHPIFEVTAIDAQALAGQEVDADDKMVTKTIADDLGPTTNVVQLTIAPEAASAAVTVDVVDGEALDGTAVIAIEDGFARPASGTAGTYYDVPLQLTVTPSAVPTADTKITIIGTDGDGNKLEEELDYTTTTSPLGITTTAYFLSVTSVERLETDWTSGTTVDITATIAADVTLGEGFEFASVRIEGPDNNDKEISETVYFDEDGKSTAQTTDQFFKEITKVTTSGWAGGAFDISTNDDFYQVEVLRGVPLETNILIGKTFEAFPVGGKKVDTKAQTDAENKAFIERSDAQRSVIVASMIIDPALSLNGEGVEGAYPVEALSEKMMQMLFQAYRVVNIGTAGYDALQRFSRNRKNRNRKNGNS